MRAIAAGDTDALAGLLQRYWALAFSVAVRIVRDHGKAEEVAQDVFLNLWHAASAFDPQRGSLRTWVIIAARNRAIDYTRGKAAHVRRERPISAGLPADGPGSNPWGDMMASVERDLIARALRTLSPGQRQVVELGFLAGYSHTQIAELTGLPLTTVKGRMRLGLRWLREYLDDRWEA